MAIFESSCSFYLRYLLKIHCEHAISTPILIKITLIQLQKLKSTYEILRLPFTDVIRACLQQFKW